jgi:chromosome segregation ATPase
VGQFALYTPKEILQKTLQSIVSPDDPEKTLFDEQVILGDQEGEKGDHQRVLDDKKLSHTSKLRQLEDMKAEVERIEARNAAQKKFDLYEIKLVIEQARLGKTRVAEKQKALDDANQALQTAEDEIKPLDANVKELTKQQAARDRTAEAANATFKTVEKSIRQAKDDVDEVDTALASAKAELDHVDKQHQILVNKLGDAERNIEKMQEQLQVTEERHQAVQNNLIQITREVEGLRGDDADVSTELNDLESMIRTKHDSATALTKRMTSLKDARQILRLKLQQMATSSGRGKGADMARGAIKAIDWFDRNADTPNLFRQQVYGPAVSYMKVRLLLELHLLHKLPSLVYIEMPKIVLYVTVCL